MEGGGGVVCLPDSMHVQWLKVYCPPGFAILFGTDDHPVAPSYRFTYWDFFKDAKPNILVKASLYLRLPVQRYRDRRVVGNRLGSGVDLHV